MSNRIEFIEVYFFISDEDRQKAEDMNLPIEKERKMRRIYVNLFDIFAPKEIPGKKSHCELEFKDGTTIIVKGSYDTICQQIDDREAQLIDILDIE